MNYFDNLPTEITILICSYCDLNDIIPEHPLKTVINDNWRLMFLLGFPKVDVTQVEIIDFASQDFEMQSFIYNKLNNIYKGIEWALEDMKDDIKYQLENLDESMTDEERKLEIESEYRVYEIKYQILNNIKLWYKHIPIKDKSITYVPNVLVLHIKVNEVTIHFVMGTIRTNEIKISFSEGFTLLMAAQNLEATGY